MDYLAEQVKTIRTLCDIALILRTMKLNDLLPTVLELLYRESQELILEHCFKDVQDDCYR